MEEKILDAVEPIMVDNDIQMTECIFFLENASEISLDLEFDKNRLRYGFNLCLMQIFCEDRCFIIDPLSKDLDISKIFPVLENPDITKIVFAFGEDLKLLLSLGCHPKNIYDLATLSRLMDMPAMSLSNLLLEKLGVTTAKSSQLSDWFKRPLSEKQIAYAADDVVFLPRLKEAFENESRFHDIAPWFEQECEELETITTSSDNDNMESFLKRKDKLKMTEHQWFVFVELMKFRDETAKSFKRPPHFIMPTELVKELVDNPRLADQWMDLPRVFKRIKTPAFKNKIQKNIYKINQDSTKKGLSHSKGAIPPLSNAQKLKNREQRSLDEKTKKEIFKPIQQELINQLGENTTNFIFSNRVIADVVAKKPDVLLPYRKDLVEVAAKKLNFDIVEFLQ